MSKPRKLATLRGKKGGKTTAGVKWKAPASAGKLRYTLKLKPGRHVFRVRAVNAPGKGPWSKETDPVRPR